MLIREACALFEPDKRVVRTCVDDLGSQAGFYERAKTLRDIQHQVFLVQPVWSDGARVVAPMPGVEHNSPNLQTKDARHGSIACSERCGPGAFNGGLTFSTRSVVLRSGGGGGSFATAAGSGAGFVRESPLRMKAVRSELNSGRSSTISRLRICELRGGEFGGGIQVEDDTSDSGLRFGDADLA